MSILFSTFVVGKGRNSSNSRTNQQRKCTMKKIKLFGKVTNKRATFRKEVKELSIDWEVSYKFQIENGKYDYVELTIESKNGYESYSTLLQDADTLTDYLEQWTEFRIEQITLT